MTGPTAADPAAVGTADPAPAGSAVRAFRDEEAMRGLVVAAQSGDEEAFVAIYRAYAPAVYRFCFARVQRPADAEDMLQQTFLRVVVALPRFEDRGLPFGAWLFRIARSVTADHHRRTRDDMPFDIRDGSFAGLAAQSTGDLGEREWLREAMAKLTRDQREVIRLRFFADLSVRESGLLLGRDEAAVRALQSRALASLRRAVDAPVRPRARPAPRLAMP